jgi:hypothetical protein
MKGSNLPPKPGIQRVAKYHEPLAYWLNYKPEAKVCGALLGKKLQHIPYQTIHKDVQRHHQRPERAEYEEQSVFAPVKVTLRFSG